MSKFAVAMGCMALGVAPLSGHHEEERHPCDPYKFKIHERPYLLSTAFQMEFDDHPIGSVVKSKLRLRTHYDLYTADGRYEGQGICRFLSLGTLYTWGTEIDVYDDSGEFVGLIEGQAITSAAARFQIFNEEEALVGIAFLDKHRTGFTIVDPDNEAKTIASLKRKFIYDAPDHWTISVKDGNVIDPRLIKVFAGFALDRQAKFRRDR